MELENWWVIPVCLALVLATAGFVAWRWRKRSARRRSAGTPVAHSERLTRLPEYRTVLNRATAGTIVAASLIGLLAVTTGILAARPIHSAVVVPEKFNRDIVLCLDVSGSMAEVDADVLDRFDQLTERFKGERIGLVLFNATAAQVFPLTDDYEFVRDQLMLVRTGIDGTGDYSDVWGGTSLASRDGASLIGDGLASCVLSFGTDQPGAADPESSQGSDKRSRSVILATDNDVNGEQLMTLEQAGQLASNRDVRVYGIDKPGILIGDSPESAEFQRVVEATGGAYFKLDDSTAVSAVIDSIQATEASLIKGTPQLVVTDQAAPWIVVSLLLVMLFLVIAWRVRL
jgi:Ca-activated chloride channel family protein